MKKLCLLIMCVVLSIGARAQFSGSGNGTENDPYLIFNPTQLSQMGNFLGQSGVVFELKNDIDLTEFINDNYPTQGWLPIGTQNSHFKGILKGNNHSIRGLVVNRPSNSYVGLFGYLEGATINNLTVSGSVIGSEYVGLLAGYAYSVTIQGCTMNIEGDNHVNANNVGGFFGYIAGGGTLSDNTVNGNIRANSNVGGFIGHVATSVSFTSCYHNGDVSGSEAVGGIVGYLNGNVNTTFNGCKNNGALYNTGIYTGGIVGKSDGYAIRGITNCSQFGNINGVDYVGGLIGYNVGDLYYSYGGTVNIKNSLCVGDVNGRDFVGGLYGDDKRGRSGNTDFLDCYYNGNISGRNNVGGLVGHKLGGNVRNCYSHATVIGASNVGGLVGHAEDIGLKACVAYNTKISSSDSNRGRIYGKRTGGSLGELGSAEGNISYNQTSVVQSGVVQEVLDDQQNGTTVGPSLLRLMATYVAKGWDFNNDWLIQETECLPYKRYQAAPPVIESNLSSNETTISGKSINGGTVYLYYKDHEAVSQECVGHNWSFSTEPLQSGAQVRIYAEVEGLTPSYLTTTNVSFPGNGTEADPYRIYTAADLQGVSKRGYYKVMNDIDLTSWIEENNPTGGWVPVGRTGAEATYIDGNGHTISGLWINSTEDWTGLFSNFDSGRIKNLTVNTAEGKKVKGGNYTGILIGRNSNGKIQNCVVNGTVEGTGCVGTIAGLSANDEITQCRVQANVISTSANAVVGGAFGQLEGGKMTKVLANVTISASGASSCVGGLVGAANADISQTVSTGIVTSTGNGTYTGGLVGQNRGTVVNSYSTVTTTGTEYTAGLVGYSFGTIDHCYAKGDIKGVKYGAGVVGEMDGTSANTKNSAAVNDKITLTDQSAWGSRVIGGYKNGTENPDNSNLALNTMQVSLNNVPQKKYDDLVEGIAKTQAELQCLATYQTLGWDMTTVWSIDEGETYPYLRMESAPTPPTPSNPDDSSDNPSDDPSDPSDVEASTDLSVYPNVLYFNDVENKVGDFNLELNMKCAEENITAFQCDVYLPEGVEWKHTVDKRGKVVYDQPTFNEDRTDESYHSISPIALNADGSYRMIVYSMANEIILETDGAILTLPLSISEEMEAGDYNLIIKGIVVTDVNKQQTLVDKVVSRLTIPSYTLGDVNGDDMINVTDVVSVIAYILGDHSSDFIFPAGDINEDGVINVTDVVSIIDIILNSHAGPAAAAKLMAIRKTLASGDTSNLEIIPFAIAEGTSSSTVKLNLNNPGDEFTAFQCDIQLPEGIDWENTVDKRGNVKYTTPVFDSEADRTDASYHTVSVQKTDGIFRVIVYSMANETILDEQGAVLDIPFVYADDNAPGVYDVSIKNVVLTRVNKTDVKPADYTFSILVGSPAESTIALKGNFTDEAINEYNTALATNTTVAAIDLSDAADVSSNTAFATGNQNLVLYVAEDAVVKNTNNVVTGDECASLILTDGYSFAAPKAFTANNASYSRTMDTTWGTICLPYAVASDESTAYYEITGVENGVITLTKYDELPAGTPALVKKLSGTEIAPQATSVAVSGDINDVTGTVKMYGSYTNKVRVEDPNSYYIYNNKFYSCNEYFFCNAFRAYFTLESAGAKMLRIADDDDVVTAIDALTGEGNGIGVESIYGEDGILRKDMEKGMNIVKFSNGKTQKIIIK